MCLTNCLTGMASMSSAGRKSDSGHTEHVHKTNGTGKANPTQDKHLTKMIKFYQLKEISEERSRTSFYIKILLGL